MGGGRLTIFNLSDANYYLVNGKVKRKSLGWTGFWREVEIFPLVVLRSRFLGWLFYKIFHPVKAFNGMKAWIIKRIKPQ